MAAGAAKSVRSPIRTRVSPHHLNGAESGAARGLDILMRMQIKDRSPIAGYEPRIRQIESTLECSGPSSECGACAAKSLNDEGRRAES